MSSRIFDEAVLAYDAQDYRTAIKLFRRLAGQGDALAQCRLGLMYYDGLGTKQNYDKAFAWVNLSATQGFSEAMEVRELLKELILKVESRKPIDPGDPIVERSQHDRRSKTNRREVTDLGYFARGGSQRRSFKDRRVNPERRSTI
ncbi:MAG: tetratricopeptide repeat protein [Arenicellales bacterium]|nr:tetratricopeptide repeat protein [Arenicellales bacterium]